MGAGIPVGAAHPVWPPVWQATRGTTATEVARHQVYPIPGMSESEPRVRISSVQQAPPPASGRSGKAHDAAKEDEEDDDDDEEDEEDEDKEGEEDDPEVAAKTSPPTGLRRVQNAFAALAADGDDDDETD